MTKTLTEAERLKEIQEALDKIKVEHYDPYKKPPKKKKNKK